MALSDDQAHPEQGPGIRPAPPGQPGPCVVRLLRIVTIRNSTATHDHASLNHLIREDHMTYDQPPAAGGRCAAERGGIGEKITMKFRTAAAAAVIACAAGGLRHRRSAHSGQPRSGHPRSRPPCAACGAVGHLHDLRPAARRADRHQPRRPGRVQRADQGPGGRGCVLELHAQRAGRRQPPAGVRHDQPGWHL